jgi:hypothetical protein
MVMAFVLRFVQRFQPSEKDAFLKLEAKFAALERRKPAFPKGRRMLPYAGREPANTLIWECEFPSLAAAQNALALLAADPDHERLFRKQSPYMADCYTEIYEVLEC